MRHHDARRARATAALAAAAFLVAACSPATEPLNTTTGLTFVADPASLFLAQNEQATVVINSFPIQGVLGTVTWTSSDPKVVTVDSSVAIGVPTTVRAVGAGTATLRATVSSTGNVVTVTVPVRVRTT